MVSDTLFEAAEEIDRYMAEFGKHYDDAQTVMIEAVCDHMRTVQAFLDRAPIIAKGTKRETVAENETRK